MGHDPEHERLAALDARIRAASGKSDAASGDAIAKAERVDSPNRIGFDFIGAVIGGAIFGFVIDRFFASSPWGVVGMSVVGFAVGMLNVWKALTAQKPEEKMD